MWFPDAIAAFLTRLAFDRTVEPDLDSARRVAAVASDTIGIVALLVPFDNAVSALQAQLTGQRVDAIELCPFDHRAIATAAITTEHVAIIADFMRVSYAVTASFTRDSAAEAIGIEGNGVAFGCAPHVIAKDTLVTDLVAANDAIAAPLAGDACYVTLES